MENPTSEHTRRKSLVLKDEQHLSKEKHQREAKGHYVYRL